jgi:hypothetical protein
LEKSKKDKPKDVKKPVEEPKPSAQDEAKAKMEELKVL